MGGARVVGGVVERAAVAVALERLDDDAAARDLDVHVVVGVVELLDCVVVVATHDRWQSWQRLEQLDGLGAGAGAE